MKKCILLLVFALTSAKLISQNAELNYDNNSNYFSLHIGTPQQSGPDLTVEGFYTSQHHVGSPGGDWNVNYRVYNMGQGMTSPESTVKIFASRHNDLTSDAVLLTQTNIPTLQVGRYYDATSFIHIPSGFSNGSYIYLIAVVDPDNLINELNKNNNSRSICIHIGTPNQNGADLTVEDLTSTQHHVGSPGGDWNITYRIYNMGQGTSSESAIAKIYISRENQLTNSAVFLTQVTIPAILVGKYYDATSFIHIPSGFAQGSYLNIFVTVNK